MFIYIAGLLTVRDKYFFFLKGEKNLVLYAIETFEL